MAVQLWFMVYYSQPLTLMRMRVFTPLARVADAL